MACLRIRFETGFERTTQIVIVAAIFWCVLLLPNPKLLFFSWRELSLIAFSTFHHFLFLAKSLSCSSLMLLAAALAGPLSPLVEPRRLAARAAPIILRCR